jgi:hypothetical protein
MKLHIAGLKAYAKLFPGAGCKYLLESFAYITQELFDLFEFESFLLDSGAFTFLSDRTVQINWQEYVKNYAEFIKRNNIENFFELDIYQIIGVPETEKLRDLLEQLTGRQPIPVWHKCLGIEYLHKLSEEYGYIAMGGFVLKDIPVKEHKYVPKLLEIAKKNNCRVHGLGFTNQKSLQFCKFYSVDSTSWIGGKYGIVYQYNGGRISYVKKKDKRTVKDVDYHNLREWVKFQRYVETHL